MTLSNIFNKLTSIESSQFTITNNVYKNISFTEEECTELRKYAGQNIQYTIFILKITIKGNDIVCSKVTVVEYLLSLMKEFQCNSCNIFSDYIRFNVPNAYEDRKINIQTKLIKYANLDTTNKTCVLNCKGDIIHLSYMNDVINATYIKGPYILDESYIKYIKSFTKGLLIVNQYEEYSNKHILELVNRLNIGEFTKGSTTELLSLPFHAIVEGFTDQYELITDLLSQNKTVIVTLKKYNSYNLLNHFYKNAPKYMKSILANSLIGAYTFYAMPHEVSVRHEFVCGMSTLRQDIISDDFTEESITLAKQTFKSEFKLSQGALVNRITPEDYLISILKQLTNKNASDLSLSVGRPPMVRMDQSLIPLDFPNLTPDMLRQFCTVVLTEEKQVKLFTEHRQINLAYSVPQVGRFRVSIYQQRGSIAASFRHVPPRAWTIQQCGIPSQVVEYIDHSVKGLFLITGPVGSGKSTAMNALVNNINNKRSAKIITIEDPIEILHRSSRSLIEQRDVGIDCTTFEEGLSQALRSDANVIEVGEVRTYEAADTVLKATRSAHMVLTTLHTTNAVQTINGYLQLFPEGTRDNVKGILAEDLAMIYSQQLLPAINGGLIPAQEILFNNYAIRNSILNDPKTIPSAIFSAAKDGMITMDKSIANLYNNGLITQDTAILYAHDKRSILKLLN